MASNPFKALSPLAPHIHWVVRLSFAATFLYHSIGHFQTLDGFAQATGALWSAALVAGLEFAGGVLILLGGLKMSNSDLMTRLAGAAIMIPMFGAIYKMHWPQWSFTATPAHPAGGMEFQVLLVAVGLCFMVLGNRALASQG